MDDVIVGASAERAHEQSFLSLAAQEKQLILRALEASNWVVYGKEGAAQRLGLNPETLRYRMKKHGLRRPR